jgi:hypothetical protein
LASVERFGAVADGTVEAPGTLPSAGAVSNKRKGVPVAGLEHDHRTFPNKGGGTAEVHHPV